MNILVPQSSLSEFLADSPLYSKFGTDQPVEAADLNNLEFNFLCQNENKIQTFRLEATSYNVLARFNSNCVAEAMTQPGHLFDETNAEFTEMFAGICQTCKNYKVTIVISSGTQREKPKYFIRKIGQYPPPRTPDVKLPKEIHYFLNDEDREFYGKALQNLESGYGTGAFAYFRRLIEKEIERIIETLSNSFPADSIKIAEAMAAYKRDQQKSKWVEDITPYLPDSLKEHGANILLLLHDAAFIDIRELTEEECIKKSKDIDILFRYLVKKIKRERDETLSVKSFG